jgi:hypothetical protein
VALQVIQQRNTLLEPLQILGHGAVFASESRVGGTQSYSQARMVGGAGFSLNSQRPEAREKRVHGVPAQGQRMMNEQLRPAQPSSYGQHRPAQRRKRRSRGIQIAEPSAQSGGIRHAIRVFDGGCGVFPAMAFQEVAL